MSKNMAGTVMFREANKSIEGSPELHPLMTHTDLRKGQIYVCPRGCYIS